MLILAFSVYYFMLLLTFNCTDLILFNETACYKADQ